MEHSAAIPASSARTSEAAPTPTTGVFPADATIKSVCDGAGLGVADAETLWLGVGMPVVGNADSV